MNNKSSIVTGAILLSGAISRLLFLLFAVFLSTSVSAMDISKYVSGGWGDRAQNGHGYSIEVMKDDLAIVFWYTYNPDGSSTFLVTVGVINGNRISGNTYYYSGMKFGEFDPSVLNEDRWGTVTVTFHDCNSATLEYSSTMSHNDVPFGSGTIQIEKIVSLQGMHCTDTPVAGNFQIAAEGSGGLSAGAGVVFENGDFAYFIYGESHAEVILAGLSPTGPKTFEINATEYSVFGGATNFSGNGAIGEDGLEIDLGAYAEFTATSMQSFQHRLPTQKLAGSYSIIDLVLEEQIGTLSVSSDGLVSGSTSSGCDLSGMFFVPNEFFNQFYVDVSLSSCATSMQIIGGGAYDFDEDTIMLVGSDPTTGYVWELR